MNNKVLTFIKYNNLIKRDSKVMVAVSGGPDSLALLYFLWKNQEVLRIKLSAMTVDHQLRGEVAAADAQYVKEICTSWQIPCVVETVDVHAYKKEHKVGTQVAARECRYEAFQKQMVDKAVDYLAFGHHADDQIETVLMALTRTTHVHNLAGMPDRRPFANGEIIRPFLCVDKTEIHAYIEANDLVPRMDASNFEKDYMRNRLRADVVPLLKQENPNLATTIGKLTKNVQEDESFLSEEAHKAFDRCVTMLEGREDATIHIKILTTYPVSLQRKVFRLILDYLYPTLPEQLSYKHEEMFFSLVRRDRNKAVDFPDGLIAERAYDCLYFYFSITEDSLDQQYSLDSVPGTALLPNGMIISCSTITAGELEAKKKDADTYIFSTAAVCYPLVIRTRNEGDRMTYDGLHGTKKLKNIFIDEKVPRYERASWPVVADATGEILWVIGLRKNTKRLPEEVTYTCMEVK